MCMFFVFTYMHIHTSFLVGILFLQSNYQSPVDKRGTVMSAPRDDANASSVAAATTGPDKAYLGTLSASPMKTAKRSDRVVPVA
jgi:hypothetical protein